MTEHTDKPTQKPGRKPPRKRSPKARAPEAKRTQAPDRSAQKAEEAAAPAASADKPRSSLAPDPATVVFGSNRPIVATPPKLPESSGLRFSGPSAGVLKASGPQPNSPKASGLTFTAAKPATATAARPRPTTAAKPAAAARPSGAPKPAVAKRPEAGKPETQAAVAKTPARPVIAPQATGPRFGKERPIGSFIFLMLVLTMVGGGLAVWMKPEPEASTAQPPATAQVAAASEAPGGDAAAPEPTPPETIADPADRTAQAASDQTAPAPAIAVTAEATAPAGLSAAEIGEIQQLLSLLDIDPGRSDGVLTAATADAIRNYQEMAGLPADGEADRALLEELRSVASLYGG